MSQALYTSKTGISAGQTQIDVIANNVANINTTAYKTANVTFSTLFSKTLSSGSAATTKGGGTNPKQIGLGTQVASIARDFNPGSFQQTGINSDLMISGNGYFVVQDGAGYQYFTRDGHFSLDSAGNLVTATGLKVVGSTNEYSTISSTKTVKVPTMLNVALSGTAKADIETKVVADLNVVDFNTGTFVLNVGGTSKDASVADFTPPDTAAGETFAFKYQGQEYNQVDMRRLSTEDRKNMTDLFGTLQVDDVIYKAGDGDNVRYVKGPIPPTGNIAVRNVQKTISYRISEGDLHGSLSDFVKNINTSFAAQRGDENIKFEVIDGGLQLLNESGEVLSVAKDGQSANFLVQSGFANSIEAGSAGQTLFYGTDLNQSVVIGDSFNSAAAIKRSDWYVSENGIITAKYNDGSQLTVSIDQVGRSTWEYTTKDNVVITGSGLQGSDVDMSGTELEAANLVIELGTVVNDSGLIAEVDNLWTIGPNAGEFAYGMSAGNGFGGLKSGGLEGSNVDMATELSNMILAQRAIQVNSRVFSTASSILETLAYLGQ